MAVSIPGGPHPLRTIRLARMLCSGREMAERVGCAVETIYSVESKRLSPSIFILNRIADAYGITIDQAFKCVKISPRLADAIEEFKRLKEAGAGE